MTGPRNSTPIIRLLEQQAVAFREKGDQHRAMEDFNRALRLDPEHIPGLYGRADLLASQGQLDGAIADLSTILRVQPGLIQALKVIGRRYIQRAHRQGGQGPRRGSSMRTVPMQRPVLARAMPTFPQAS